MDQQKIQQEYTKNIWGLSIPVLALDVVIFTIYRGKLCVVVTKRMKEPDEGKYILPGGIVRSGMNLEENFDDILLRKTGISGVYKEQLYTFGDPTRDTRGHIVSVSYYALVRDDLFRNNADFSKIHLIEYDSIKPSDIGFDHYTIIQYAHQRLAWKIEYTNIAANILPDAFTLSELQNVYETILRKALDKRNFRKKILSLDVIRETGALDRESSNRPAKLYEFQEKTLKIIEIL